MPDTSFDLRADPREADETGHSCVVCLPRYWLARYPVTVAQWTVYAHDVRSGKWRRTAKGPGESPDPRSLRGQCHAPVVYVSWHDAADYCRWLTTQLRSQLAPDRDAPDCRPTSRPATRDAPPNAATRWLVTLPSEAEWEKAARGPAGASAYPWGDGWEPNRANGADSLQPRGARLSGGVSARRTVVGCFGSGARALAPFPTEDLSGNVYEWTRCRPSDYPYKPDYISLSPLRIIRGGSFLNSPVALRSAFREWRNAGERFHNVGFRIAITAWRSATQ